MPKRIATQQKKTNKKSKKKVTIPRQRKKALPAKKPQPKRNIFFLRFRGGNYCRLKAKIDALYS